MKRPRQLCYSPYYPLELNPNPIPGFEVAELIEHLMENDAVGVPDLANLYYILVFLSHRSHLLTDWYPDVPLMAGDEGRNLPPLLQLAEFRADVTPTDGELVRGEFSEKQGSYFRGSNPLGMFRYNLGKTC